MFSQNNLDNCKQREISPSKETGHSLVCGISVPTSPGSINIPKALPEGTGANASWKTGDFGWGVFFGGVHP